MELPALPSDLSSLDISLCSLVLNKLHKPKPCYLFITYRLTYLGKWPWLLTLKNVSVGKILVDKLTIGFFSGDKNSFNTRFTSDRWGLSRKDGGVKTSHGFSLVYRLIAC